MTGRSLDIDRWAEIVVKEWVVQIENLGVHDSFALTDSFTHMAYRNANGDIDKVMFLFNFYGKFAEMAVGRSMPFDWAKSPVNKREARPWYTRTFRAQVHRLRELLQEKYAGEAQRYICARIKEESLSGKGDLKGMGGVGV